MYNPNQNITFGQNNNSLIFNPINSQNLFNTNNSNNLFSNPNASNNYNNTNNDDMNIYPVCSPNIYPKTGNGKKKILF